MVRSLDDIAPWDTQAECQAFVDRVRPEFEETAIFDVHKDDEGTWDIAMFDSDTPIGTRFGCIAENTELTSRKHGRRFCGAS